MTVELNKIMGISSNTYDFKESGINTVYESDAKAYMYEATQEVIVPKKPMFQAAIELMETKLAFHETLVIYDLGSGVGNFLFEFLSSQFCLKCKYVKYNCVDLSSAMLRRIDSRLEESLYDHPNVDINLITGVNLVNRQSMFYEEMEQADLIFASQLEHYIPNSNYSPLGEHYRNSSIDYLTKREFRDICMYHLKKGGLYISIDDRQGETIEEDKVLNEEWDAHVLKSFSDEAVIREISNQFPTVGDKIAKQYLNTKMSIDRVARIRNHRRSTTLEEVEKLSKTKQDFIEMFGAEKMGTVPHPLLNKFYLAYGVSV